MDEYERKPQPGDLIEICRGLFQHWAIYVGGGYVIHLVPPSEHAQSGSYSLMSVAREKAVVRKHQLYEIAGDHDYHINNLLDDEYEPRPIEDILRDAYRCLGRELTYSVVTGNCEHFVTELRYGKPQSRQVRRAVEIGVASGISIAVLAYAVVKIFGSNNRDRHNERW